MALILQYPFWRRHNNHSKRYPSPSQHPRLRLLLLLPVRRSRQPFSTRGQPPTLNNLVPSFRINPPLDDPGRWKAWPTIAMLRHLCNRCMLYKVVQAVMVYSRYSSRRRFRRGSPRRVTHSRPCGTLPSTLHKLQLLPLGSSLFQPRKGTRTVDGTIRLPRCLRREPGRIDKQTRPRRWPL